jgi:hypothetical protein
MSAPGARWVIFLAACIWHVGIIALLWRGALLLLDAERIDPGRGWPWLGIPAALLIGVLKGRLLLVRAVVRNKARIATLERPRPWHVYHPGFFLFLVANVLLARWVIAWSAGQYALTILCGTMLLSIGVALFVSSPAWWRRSASA